MNVSRVSKLVNDSTKAGSLRESDTARVVPFSLVLSDAHPAKIATMAHVAVTLALRCFTGPVRVYGDARRATELSAGGTLGEYVGRIADAYGAPHRLEWAAGEPSSGPTLHLGRGPSSGFVADAVGWTAGVNTVLRPQVDAEVPASVFAVSCAFAQLFGETLLGRPRQHAWSVFLRNMTGHTEISDTFTREPTDCGEITLLGAGAIGSAFAYLLWLSGWSARVVVLDRDSYDEPNLETSCLIGREHVRRCLPKAPALAECMRREGLQATGRVEEVRAGSPVLGVTQRFFVCGVDNSETRRELDAHGSSWLLNAGVGGSSRDVGHVLYSRHGAGDPLLSTCYPARAGAIPGLTEVPESGHVPREMAEECSRIPYQGISAAAPFVATTAAALIATACAGGVASMPRYVKIDLLGMQDRMDVRD
jgi:hypothetical protein